MKKTGFIVTMLAMVLLASPVTSLQAAQDGEYFVGCIDDMRGDVQIFKAAKNLWIPAKKLIPVEEKDIIKTGRLSYCRLLLDDGSAFRLDANSQLALETLKIDKKNDTKVQTYHLKVDFGVLISVFNKKKSSAAKFRVRTPVAVMSIRGTDFAVSVKGEKTKVGLFDGSLTVTDLDEKNEVQLSPDQEADILKGKAPAKKDYLSSSMQKEKRRSQKLREYADKIRKKLDERDTYIQDRIKQREQRLKDWDQKRKERLGDVPEPDEESMDSEMTDAADPAEMGQEAMEPDSEGQGAAPTVNENNEKVDPGLQKPEPDVNTTVIEEPSQPAVK